MSHSVDDPFERRAGCFHGAATGAKLISVWGCPQAGSSWALQDEPNYPTQASHHCRRDLLESCRWVNLTLIGSLRHIGHHLRKFLDEVRLRAFWQVECKQFPVPMNQSKPNTETLVGRSVNRNGYIKCSAAVIRVEPDLPSAAETVGRKRCRKTRPQRWIGGYRSFAKQIAQSLWVEYFSQPEPNCRSFATLA